jgi:hypothetical protein
MVCAAATTLVADIKGAPTVGIIIEYLRLWDIIPDTVLQPQREDKHIWRFSSNGQNSAKSAYEGFFLGATLFAPWELVWNTSRHQNAGSSCG